MSGCPQPKYCASSVSLTWINLPIYSYMQVAAATWGDVCVFWHQKSAMDVNNSTLHSSTSSFTSADFVLLSSSSFLWSTNHFLISIDGRTSWEYRPTFTRIWKWWLGMLTKRPKIMHGNLYKRGIGELVRFLNFWFVRANGAVHYPCRRWCYFYVATLTGCSECKQLIASIFWVFQSSISQLLNWTHS